MNQLKDMINYLGGNYFILEFINENSTTVRDLYLPSILYTKESIMNSETLTTEEAIQGIQKIDSMNQLVKDIFDVPQINLIMVHVINEIIERMEGIREELTKGNLLSIILNNNRPNPTLLTREYELNEITNFVYKESINAFIENALDLNNPSENDIYIVGAIKNIFSYNLINKMCVDTIDLFDTYIFKRFEEIK